MTSLNPFCNSDGLHKTFFLLNNLITKFTSPVTAMDGLTMLLRHLVVQMHLFLN